MCDKDSCPKTVCIAAQTSLWYLRRAELCGRYCKRLQQRHLLQTRSHTLVSLGTDRIRSRQPKTSTAIKPRLCAMPTRFLNSFVLYRTVYSFHITKRPRRWKLWRVWSQMHCPLLYAMLRGALVNIKVSLLRLLHVTGLSRSFRSFRTRKREATVTLPCTQGRQNPCFNSRLM